MIYTFNDKSIIKQRLEKLNTFTSIYIFNILKKNNEKYTVNTNGLFFDLLEISNKSIEEIEKYLDDLNNKNKNKTDI